MRRQEDSREARDRRKRRAWAWRALALLLVFGLANLCGGSGPGRLPSPGIYEVSATNPTPPNGPVTVTGADRALTATWPASNEITTSGYRVYLDGVFRVETAQNVRTATLTGLVNGRTYVVTVRTLSDFLGTTYEGTSAATGSGRPHDGLPPATPAGLVATGADRQVGLTWTATSDLEVDGYELRRDGVLIATPAGTASSYTDTGRTNGVAHTYELVAVDFTSRRSTAATASATARDAVAPAPPTGLVATPSDRQVALTWAANGEYDLLHYRVFRDGAPVATVTGTTWTDTGRTNGVTSSYALVAVDTSGNESAPSDPAVQATPRDAVAPAAPAGLAATPADREVTLSWTANGEYDIKHYRVIRDGLTIATVTGTGYSDTGLVNGRSYVYSVRAVDTSDNESGSSSVAATPRDTVAPAVPADLTATSSDRQVALSWTANGEYDVAHYRVLRDGVEIAVVTGTGHLDTGRTNGVAHTYTVIAVDTSDNESGPASVTGTARDAVAPAAPSGLVATPGDGEVSLAWGANTEGDLLHYRVLRDGVEIAVVTATTYVDTGRPNGVAATYTLVAVDTSGNESAPSSGATATPDDPPPAAPTGVTATAGDGQATISWNAAPEGDVVSHRVLAEDGSTVATVAAPGTQTTVTGLANGTTYRYSVVAVDATGHVSPASATVAVTPSSPATGVPAEGAGQTGGFTVSGDGRYAVIGTHARLEPSDTNTAYELYLLDRTADTARRVHPLAASASGATDPVNASAPVISDDGRYLALATTAKLVPSDTNNRADVYRLDLSTGIWGLVSVPASTGLVHPSVAGTLLHPGTTATSPAVAMTADGGTVLFYSERADLVPSGDTNGVADVFAKNMTTGAVTRVSATAANGNVIGVATGPALAVTPDGRFALFTHVAGGTAKLYRKTLSGAGAGDLTVLSTRKIGGVNSDFGVNRDAGDVAISDDGRYVALVTNAKVAPPATGTWPAALAYRLDTTTGTFAPLGSGQTTVLEHRVELDPTGRYGFYSTIHAALPGDTNGHSDFYRRDLDGGGLTLVTADAGGNPTTGPTGPINAAEYGRLFATSGSSVLMTTSQALLAADTNRIRDLYAKDLVTGAVGSPLG